MEPPMLEAWRFGATLFLSAALLFLLEPMVGKMLMPLLGGAAAVWITCMVFFQGALLAGYTFAHASLARFGERRQAVLQIALLALGASVLPFRIGPNAARALVETSSPALTLCAVLVATVGLPFFALSTVAPVLQSWFAAGGRGESRDPYFLYSASNLGSMLALAAYPAVIEPRLGLARQTDVWRAGYFVFVGFVLACSATLLRRPKHADVRRSEPIEPERVPLASDRIAFRKKLRWIGLAFVPTSLLLGLTTYVTTDIAPIPLFWVVPLAIYLFTFVLVFARRPPLRHEWMVRILPFSASATVLMMIANGTEPMALILAPHVATLFFGSMVCHGELANDRPRPAYLTEFYLLVSLGGVLGGIYNGLIAPALFRHVIEYPMAVVLTCLCRRVEPTPVPDPARSQKLDILLPLALAFVTAAIGLSFDILQLPFGTYRVAFFAGIPILINTGFLGRPFRFGLGLGACLLGSAVLPDELGRTLGIERNFFGVVRVSEDPTGHFVQIAHGNTIHGRQSLRPEERRAPLTYYTRSGPLGQIFDGYRSAAARSRAPDAPPLRVGVIGLGAGSMAPYAQPDEDWTYYELNPLVLRIAENPRYFTLLADAFPDKTRLRVELGDARLRLQEAKDGAFNLLVIDAFSSDSIPMHLLTREAIALYRNKMQKGAILAAHISNRYLDLEPVFGAVAEDAGLVARSRHDTRVSDAELAQGKIGSVWVALASTEAALGTLAQDPRWQPIRSRVKPVWTDDYSDLVGVYRHSR
jgi:hypothetical protein